MSEYVEDKRRSTQDVPREEEQRVLERLERAGTRLSKLRIAHLEWGERGVVTRQDLAPGEEVLFVPRQCLLTLEHVRASDIGRLIQAHAPDTSEESYMAAFLLAHREDPDWKPYFDLVPSSFPHLPFFFDAGELSLLNGSIMLREIARWRELLLSRYAYLCDRVPGFSRFTPDAFLWAQFVLLSRTFGLLLDGQHLRCFVPLADMLNHRASPQVTWGTSEDGAGFVLVARQAVSAGEQLHISYGAKPNYRFLLNYGFVPEFNPDDALVLYLGIDGDDSLAARKRELLALSTPAAQRRFEVPLHYEHPSTAAMFSFLRVSCADAGELEHLTQLARAEQGLDLVPPLSRDTEERVFRKLGALCEARLAGFDTSLEEDELLLHEVDFARNERNCLLLRRGEKRLLHAYAGLARTFLPLLREAEPPAAHGEEG